MDTGSPPPPPGGLPHRGTRHRWVGVVHVRRIGGSTRRVGEREADVEQAPRGLLVLGALDQGGEQGGAELGPVGQVHVGQAGEGVEDLDHRDRHPGLAQPVEELEQRGLQRPRPHPCNLAHGCLPADARAHPDVWCASASCSTPGTRAGAWPRWRGCATAPGSARSGWTIAPRRRVTSAGRAARAGPAGQGPGRHPGRRRPAAGPGRAPRRPPGADLAGRRRSGHGCWPAHRASGSRHRVPGPCRTPAHLAVEVGDPERLGRERLAWLAGVADDVLVAAADVDRVAEQAGPCGRRSPAGRDRPASGWRSGCRCRSAGRWPRPRPAGTPSRPSPTWAARPGGGVRDPGALPGRSSPSPAGVTDLRCVLPNAPDVTT